MARKIIYRGKKLEEWLKLLSHRNKHPREIAAVALGRIGRPAKGAVPALSRMLVGNWQLAREDTSLAFKGILAKATKDKCPDVRVAAAYALGEIGAKGKVAPVLEMAMTDSSKRVRFVAALALQRAHGSLAVDNEKMESWDAFLSRKRAEGWKGW